MPVGSTEEMATLLDPKITAVGGTNCGEVVITARMITADYCCLAVMFAINCDVI